MGRPAGEGRSGFALPCRAGASGADRRIGGQVNRGPTHRSGEVRVCWLRAGEHVHRHFAGASPATDWRHAVGDEPEHESPRRGARWPSLRALPVAPGSRYARVAARTGFASIPGGLWLKLETCLDRRDARWGSLVSTRVPALPPWSLRCANMYPWSWSWTTVRPMTPRPWRQRQVRRWSAM